MKFERWKEIKGSGNLILPVPLAYIFEFKMEDAEKALAQIHEKKYHEKYKIKNKEIILVGVAFSQEERNIKGWIIEKVQ